jgi:Tetracyclin repressor-like, C-terminal domain
MGIKSNKAIVAMLKTSSQQLTTDPQLVASMLQGAMAGVSRRLLESTAPEKQFDHLHRELILMACAYLDACSARLPLQA